MFVKPKPSSTVILPLLSLNVTVIIVLDVVLTYVIRSLVTPSTLELRDGLIISLEIVEAFRVSDVSFDTLRESKLLKGTT